MRYLESSNSWTRKQNGDLPRAGRERMGGYHLLVTGFLLVKRRRILEMEGGDGATIM